MGRSGAIMAVVMVVVVVAGLVRLSRCTFLRIGGRAVFSLFGNNADEGSSLVVVTFGAEWVTGWVIRT